MLSFELWREVFSAIRAQGMRAYLTALGVFWGMFLLLLLLGVAKGLEKGTLASFGSYSKNSLFLWEGQRGLPFASFAAGKVAHGNIEDIHALEKAIPAIRHISPKGRADATTVVKSTVTSGSFPVFGVYPDFSKIQMLKIKDGRFINQRDLESGRRLAVIGDRVAKTLFTQPNPCGQRFEIQGVVFYVVGTIKSSAALGGPAEDDDGIFVPFSALEQSFSVLAPTEVIAISSDDSVSHEALKKKVRAILSERRKFDLEDPSALFIFDHEEESAGFRALFAAITAFTWFVGLSTLMSGMVGVSNIMLVSVRERVREFGIRKALGATPRMILVNVICEAFILSFSAGYLGLLAGLAALKGIQALHFSSPYFRDPEVSLVVAFSSLAVLVVAGCFAGLIPALRASRISAVEALRSLG